MLFLILISLTGCFQSNSHEIVEEVRHITGHEFSHYQDDRCSPFPDGRW